MVDGQAWESRRKEEFEGLRAMVKFVPDVLLSSDPEGVDQCQTYGLALLQDGVEVARGIELCLRDGTPGPAFALARVLYEAVLRGHVILHELGPEDCTTFWNGIKQWDGRKTANESPPQIEVRQDHGRLVVHGTKVDSRKRAFRCPNAQAWPKALTNMRILHDLTHGGITQAIQMFDGNRTLGPRYSARDQAHLLAFAECAILFAALTWPGALEANGPKIHQRGQDLLERLGRWEEGVQHAT